MRHEIIAGLFLVTAMTVLGLISWGVHQRNLKVRAEAAYTQQSVELEGAKRALLIKPKEIVKFITLPPAVKEAVKKGRMTPVAAAKLTATAEPVVIPCPPQPVFTTEATTDAAPITHTNPVTFGLTGELFIGKVVGGAVEYTSSLKGTAHMTEPEWHSDIEFKPENVVFDVRVSADIAKAVEAYEQPWAKKHLRWMCPGIFGGLDLEGNITGGVGCAWGVVW